MTSFNFRFRKNNFSVTVKLIRRDGQANFHFKLEMNRGHESQATTSLLTRTCPAISSVKDNDN